MVAASKGPSNEEFYSRVMPDEGMLAFVDYCTGLLSINATEEQYRAMIVESSQNHAASGPYPSLRHWRMMEAQWHEMVHCLQLSVCGFAYKLASDLWRVVTDDLAVQELSSLPDIYQAISPGTLSRVQKIISRLDESTEGVSVLSILESSAFLAQKRQAYPNLTESSFRKLFLDANFRPESPYRAAYDFVDQHLPRGGPTVFDVFQSFAFPSLFAVEPAAAFTQLVRSTVIPQGTPPEQWEWIIGEAWQRLGIHSYGMASEVYRKLDAYHPVFSSVLARLATQIQGRGHKTISEVMRAPHKLSNDVIAIVISPVVVRGLNGSLTIVDYNKRYEKLTSISRDSEFNALTIISALFSEALGRNPLAAHYSVFRPLHIEDPLLSTSQYNSCSS